MPGPEEELRPGHVVLLDIVARGVGGVIDTEAHDSQAAIFAIGGIEGFESRGFFKTGAAPGGPEVEQDIFAAEIEEFHGFAVEVGGLEIRGEAADLGVAGLGESERAEINSLGVIGDMKFL